jgi:hypothetical protein
MLLLSTRFAVIRSESRHHHGIHSRMLFRDLVEERVPVHVGHLSIGQNHIERLCRHQTERFGAVVSAACLEACALKKSVEHGSQYRVVVDDQHSMSQGVHPQIPHGTAR